MITGLYAAILAFIQVILAFEVVRLRVKHKVALGNPDNNGELARARSVHGNLTENVPIFLILMLIIEFGAPNFAPDWVLHGLGIAVVLSRISHVYNILIREKPYGLYRAAGMFLVFIAILIAAGLCIALYLLQV